MGWVFESVPPIVVLQYQKNDDYVKEAPAYCRSFLDGLHTVKGGGKQTDRQTARPRY